jgi:hypothetical protein
MTDRYSRDQSRLTVQRERVLEEARAGLQTHPEVSVQLAVHNLSAEACSPASYRMMVSCIEDVIVELML